VSGGIRPRACGECLKRAWLVGSLSADIERAVGETPGSRAREVLALPDQDLTRAMAGRSGPDLLERAESLEPASMAEAVAGARAWATCRHDKLYPLGLLDLSDPPATLFGRGDASLLAQLGAESVVTIVGSRRPSGYGRELAATLASEVASAGMAVVSGMAIGIDSCAHRGTLQAEGLTVAVLGTGVDVAYPSRNRTLYEEIVETGLIVSELPPGTTARRWTFPARNRIMAALGAMTIVVEARERSGSLITAGMAADLGREVGAVPGRVGTSSATGTNGLLRDGSQVIRGGQDVLDSLLGPGAGRGLSTRGPALDVEPARVLELVEGGATSADALGRESGLDPGSLAATLINLELGGYVRADSAGRYERTALEQPHESRQPAAPD
jgi:DNA processing protein